LFLELKKYHPFPYLSHLTNRPVTAHFFLENKLEKIYFNFEYTYFPNVFFVILYTSLAFMAKFKVLSGLCLEGLRKTTKKLRMADLQA
jgi:hypothetical protein